MDTQEKEGQRRVMSMSSVLRTCDFWQHQRLCVTCSVAVCTRCETERNLIRVLAEREREEEREDERERKKGKGQKEGQERCCSNASVRFTAKSQHLSLSRETREMSSESCIQLFVQLHSSPSFGAEASFMLGQP